MKHLLLAILILATGSLYAQAYRPNQPQTQQPQVRIDPAKVTPGAHADTVTIQINYKNLRYDPKGHILTKYFIFPSKKYLETSKTILDSSYKVVKIEDIADLKN